MAGKVSKHCRPFLIKPPRSGMAHIGHHLLIFSNANNKWQLVNKRPFYIIYYITLPRRAVRSNLDDSYGVVSLCVSRVLQMGRCVLRRVSSNDFFAPVYLFICSFD